MPNMITGGTNERTDEIGSSNVVIMLLVGYGYRLYVYRWCGLSFLPSYRSHMGQNARARINADLDLPQKLHKLLNSRKMI